MACKGIVAMAPFRVYQIQDLDDIAFFLQQMAGVPQKFSLGVQDHKGSVGLHDIRLRIKASLAGTGTTANQDIQVPAVLPTVQAQRHLLGQQFIFISTLAVFLADCPGIAPPGRTLFLPPPVDTLVGNVDANAQAIEHEEDQQCFEALVTPDDMKGIFQCCTEALQQRTQTTFQ